MIPGRPILGKRAKTLISNGAQLFDTRDPVAFRDHTLPSAKNLQLRQVSTLMTIPRNVPLIFFGDGADDSALHAIVNYASQFGFKEVYMMKSMDDWYK
jgi:rhodanese-related sulfurtransferase